MRKLLSATLILEDGTRYEGYSFGAETSTSAEIVFNSAMTGYPESLTDPSFEGQIMMLTYPVIGNYGVPSHESRKNGLLEFFESEKIHIKGLVVADYSFEYSHWNAVESLSEWLVRENVPAIFGIDTRDLTKKLREKGTMLAKILVEGAGDCDFVDYSKENLVEKVSTKETVTYGDGDINIVMIDCGVKYNFIRCLLKRGAKVTLVPWNTDVAAMNYDGLMISNGPGDPSKLQVLVDNIKKAMNNHKPIFGMGLGNELLALAAGASTYKMKYGHRGHNQPAHEVGTNTTVVTCQNHGYAIDTANMSSDWKVLYENLNDGTAEGIIHKSEPFFSVQFHPDETLEKADSEVMFDKFIDLVKSTK